jgi:adenylate kinase
MRIFVAGLSKSGKSTRSHQTATMRSDLDYVSVSKLLKDTGGILPVLTINDALLNQHKAAEELGALPRQKPYQLIDGHALIETAQGPFAVPDAFFDEIQPSLLIYIEDTPEDLYQRRLPLGMTEMPTELAALAAMERAVCERIAARRRTPLIVLISPTPECFAVALVQEIEKLNSSSFGEDH